MKITMTKLYNANPLYHVQRFLFGKYGWFDVDNILENLKRLYLDKFINSKNYGYRNSTFNEFQVIDSRSWKFRC
uniref:Transposase n=1 Tax=Strongyloides venezuelensis TaxID=75913 RepID=A0A0K0G587_STRVS